MGAREVTRSPNSPGARFRAAVENETPLQAVGTMNDAYHARLAQHVGFRAVYLSCGNASTPVLGLPDRGVSLADVLIEAWSIINVCDLPLLVDADDLSVGGTLNVVRTVKLLSKLGAAACHIGDETVLSQEEMRDRVKAAVDARTDPSFVIVARIDVEGAAEALAAAIQRARAYVEAGADMLFPDGVFDLATYRAIADAVKVPVVANIAELARTPLFTPGELRAANVTVALYPLPVFRAMNALDVYTAIRQSGTQGDVEIQPRDELAEHLAPLSCEAHSDYAHLRRR
jgi:methylisocitrate lyase